MDRAVEHAALCPMYLGVKAIIANLERIHANLVNFGIIRCLSRTWLTMIRYLKATGIYRPKRVVE
jgi:hypothetical protein